MAVNQEWLNQNAYRAFPFKEDATLMPVDSTGILLTDIHLPTYVVVDFILTIANPGQYRIYLSKLAFVGGFLTGTFADADGTVVAAFTADIRTHVANTAYLLYGQDEAYGDARGKIVLGNLSTLQQDLPDGLYEFNIAQSEIEPACIRPEIRGVRSFRVANADNSNISDFITGHVKLIAGTNIRLTYVPDHNAIRIDAISGEGLNETCDCDDAQIPQCIRSINCISVQDVRIEAGDDCVEVDVSGNRITISEKCCKPCCGCEELEFINTHMRLLETTLSKLENYEQDMDAHLQEFYQNVLVSI